VGNPLVYLRCCECSRLKLGSIMPIPYGRETPMSLSSGAKNDPRRLSNRTPLATRLSAGETSQRDDVNRGRAVDAIVHQEVTSRRRVVTFFAVPCTLLPRKAVATMFPAAAKCMTGERNINHHPAAIEFATKQRINKTSSAAAACQGAQLAAAPPSSHSRDCQGAQLADSLKRQSVLIPFP